MSARNTLLRGLAILAGTAVLLLVVVLAIQSVPGGGAGAPGINPYPVSKVPYPPPRATDDPAIFLTATTAALEEWNRNNPTPEPVSTRLPTPQVTPHPVASAPVINMDGCPGSTDEKIYFRDGDRLVSTRPGQSRPDEIIDVQSELGLVLAGDALGIHGTEWIDVSSDGMRAALVLSSSPGPHERGEPLIDVGVYILDLMGGDVRLLAPQATQPKWSPDGSRIAYRLHGNLWVMDVKTGKARELYKAEVDNERRVDDLEWSPDGNSIVFIDELFRQERILKVVDAGTGAEIFEVEHPLWFIFSPQWSPNGSLITYTTSDGISSSSDVFSNLWVVGSDGTGRRQITQDLNVYSTPQWSPDGNWIAFAGPIGYEQDQPRYDVWLVDPSGADLKRLTATDTVNESAPVWSKDCSLIFVSVDDGHIKAISLMDGKDSDVLNARGKFVISK